MFKKLLFLVVIGFSVLLLSACGERTYKADGVYTAFTSELTKGGGPQVTFVSVTIEKDKIVDFNIDCIQSAATKNAEGITTAWNFNAKSKKDLGFLYGMHNVNDAAASYTRQDLSTTAGLAAYKAYLTATGKLEWHEQAELIEAAFVANGVDAVTKNATNYIDNVTGVSIADGNYTTMAKKAVENAIAGTTQVITTSADDIVFVTATVDSKGKITALQLDTLQGVYPRTPTADSKFSWRADTKQELQFLYGMHNGTADHQAKAGDLTVAANMTAYKAWLEANNKLEWHTQADIITDYVLANGLSGIKVNATTNKLADDADEALAGVSITVSSYKKVIEQAYASFTK